MIVCGVDPSLTQTAVVIGTSPTDFRVSFHRSKPLGDRVCHRVARYDSLVASVMKSINDVRDEALGVTIKVFVEGYAYGAKMNREILGEFGGILRWHLVDIDAGLEEIAPMMLKKFATGKGAGKKDQMMMHVQKNWGYEAKTSDDCDAYSLFRLGLCVCNLDQPANQTQREVVGKLRF